VVSSVQLALTVPARHALEHPAILIVLEAMDFDARDFECSLME
jgi:hypothetical protein